MRARSVIAALTLAAIPMTAASFAFADEPFGPVPPAEAPAAASAAPAAPSTPLAVRPSAPVQLAPDTHLGWGTKAMLMIGIAGVGYIFWKKRKDQATTPRIKRTLSIAARTSIGVRSELILVDVEGQTLLLGVTPSSIQRLAIVGETPIAVSDFDADDVDLKGRDSGAESGFALPAGGASAPLARILDRAAAPKTSAAAATARRDEQEQPAPVAGPTAGARRPRVRREAAVEGQVRGLVSRGQG